VVSRLVEQTQDFLRQGMVTQWLLKPDSGRRYIDLSGVDEVEAIANRILSLLVHHILPKVQPDIEALIQHSLNRILQQIPLYPALQQIPGLSDFPQQLTAQLSIEFSNTTYRALVSALEDTTAKELVRRLIDHLGDAFRTEIQQERTIQEIEALVVVLLDEIKINYVKQINVEGIDSLPKPVRLSYPLTRIS